MQKALHSTDATFLAMWYGMNKIQQKCLKIAGLLLLAILFVIIILAAGSPKEHPAGLFVLVVILFVLLAVVTVMKTDMMLTCHKHTG